MALVEIHPGALAELEEASEWYEERSAGLGASFLEEIDRAMSRIVESPARWRKYGPETDVRRFLVHRFPYAVIYRHSERRIEIVAVMHLHREPYYWRDRLGS